MGVGAGDFVVPLLGGLLVGSIVLTFTANGIFAFAAMAFTINFLMD